MKTIRLALVALFSLVVSVLQAQEHGPVIGTSYGTFYEKDNRVTVKSDGYKFHYHAGYSYRQHFKHKIALDVTALYGTQGTDYQYKIYDLGKTDTEDFGMKSSYVSLGAVASYECFKNFRVGVGAEFSWSMTKISEAHRSFHTNYGDVPLLARVSYSLKYVELQLSYKQGLFSVIDNPTLGKLKTRDLQLSVFVPLFK